jgi:RNA recognition motif-containing protein
MKSISKRLFVGSLPYRYSESELLKLFIPYGKVVDVRVIKNHWGRSRGLGYIEFETVEEAVLAKEKLHQYQVKDMTIIVDFAKDDPSPVKEDEPILEDKNRDGDGDRNKDKDRDRNKTRDRNNAKDRNKSRDRNKTRDRNRKSQPIIRQTVYNSKNFGAKIGRKFASRTKKRIKS